MGWAKAINQLLVALKLQVSVAERQLFIPIPLGREEFVSMIEERDHKAWDWRFFMILLDH